MASPARWRIERSTAMRADAPSLFVPRNDLPNAALGDVVSISGAQPGDERTGVVSELVDDDDRGRFVVIELDAAQREDDAVGDR